MVGIRRPLRGRLNPHPERSVPSYMKPQYMNVCFLFLLAFLSTHFNAFAGDETDKRRYPDTVLFINNHKYGENNGCTGLLSLTGQSSCGHKGAVSEVTWSFLRTNDEGDVYTFTRKYPSNTPSPETSTKESTKEVTYSGKKLILWSDDVQKILIKPKGT